MQVNQIYALVNDVVKQAFGEKAVTATDLTGLIAMGNSVLSSETNVDAFNHALIDRIGRVVISSRVYSREGMDIMFNTFEYGCIMQKITVQPLDAVNAPQWGLTSGQSVDQYLITKADVKQKLFDGLTTWEIDITIPDYQLKSAFTSPEAMAAFVDSIFTVMSNSLELQLERVGEMAVANFIAEKIYAQTQEATANGIHVVNLLQAYNADTTSTLTAKEALTNTDFLKYATRKINLFIDRFRKMSKLFNTDGFARFTPRDLVRVTMLADFTTAASYYLQSDTFHKDLVELPLYREVQYWQGSGTTYDFGETSTIDITTSSGNVVKQDGVVCLINDIEAIGMTCDNRRMRSSPPNGRGEYTNYFSKADIRYYNDLSENALVFTVTDTPFGEDDEGDEGDEGDET